jgi:geranylgeranyl reductase family protein
MVYDVIVVGAGPSGSILAYLLAAQGISTLLLEKETLPRYKACGGGLTYKAIQNIPFSVKPLVEVEALGGVVSYKGNFLLKVNVDQPFAALVMRDKFDYYLAQKAVEAGACLREKVVFNGLEQEASFVIAQTSQGIFTGRWLVGADGVNSAVARSIGLLSNRVTGVALEAEVKVPQFAQAQQNAYATFDFGALRNGYGWIFPKSDHLSVGILQTRPDRSTDIKIALKNFIASQAVLAGCTIIKQKGHLIPIGGQSEILHSSRVLLVGDAANLADPWLGEGLYYAIASARIAAEILQTMCKKENGDLSLYTTQINRGMITQFKSASAFAKFVYRNPYLGSKILSKSPGMQKTIFNAISGKITYQRMNQTLLKQLPSILFQSLSGAEGKYEQ